MKRVFVLVLVVAGMAWLAGVVMHAGPAENPQGGPPTVGQRVDSALGALGQDARSVVQDIRQGFQRARESVDQMGTQARVYARLHWDKALAGSDVSLDMQDDGHLTLRGTVPNAAARAKAVLLAQDTVGVVHVDDALQIQPAPQP